MGALTLKSFPFILRGWDIKNYDSIDPTDSFGQETKVYINKNHVIKIEPQFSNNSSYTWLTDKGRQFFDSIFGEMSENNTQLEHLPVKTTNRTFYTFDIFNFKSTNRHFSSFLLLVCDAPDFWKLKLQDPTPTSYYLIHIGVFLMLLALLGFLLQGKIFKNFSKKSKLLLLLISSIISLYFGYYVLATYIFVGAVFLYIGLEKLKFGKQELKLENHKIDCEVLPDIFELKYYHIIFIILTLTIIFFFNVLISAFYFTFIVLGYMSAVLKLNIYDAIPKKLYLYLKNHKKDLNTIKYHWSTNFFFLKIFNRLTLVSLPLGVFVLALALPFHIDNDPVLLLNLYEICIISCITFIVSFLTDIYIILFGNSSVLQKFGGFCYKCAVYGTLGLSGGHPTEKQFLHNSFDKLGFKWQPTLFTNIPRVLAGLPIVNDYDQFWGDHLIQKYLPEITQEQYTSKYNNIVTQIDSVKANRVLIENWDTVSKNATKQELNRVSLGTGYMSNIANRR